MLVVLLGLTGLIWGAVLARKRGGNAADIAQYAAGFGIALGLAGFVLIVLISAFAS
jgi:hypothetical protein